MENRRLDFQSEWNNSDQVLVVQNKELHVHRCMLSLWSPVFDRMFNSNFKEKESRRVELKGKLLTEIEELLHVLYERADITDDNFDFLLEFSEEYQITQLRNECIKFLQTVDRSGKNATKYLSISARFSIPFIKEECINELACIPHSELEKDENYSELNEQLKNAILTARVKRLEVKAGKHNSIMNSLTKYLYSKASEHYIEFLRQQGFEETVLNRCPNRDDHVNLRIGQNFDINCPMCRKNVTVTKKFDVDTNTIGSFMEKMYMMTIDKGIESQQTLKEAKGSLKCKSNGKDY